MKANELMLGDFVTFKDCQNDKDMVVIKIWEINQEGNAFVFIDDSEVLDEVFIDEDFVGITLTPEILEKNGFTANTHVYPYPYYEYINKEDELKVGFAFPQVNRTSYNEPWVYIDTGNVFIEHLPCVFVHQLQHALKLCGIEKTIEL